MHPPTLTPSRPPTQEQGESVLRPGPVRVPGQRPAPQPGQDRPRHPPGQAALAGVRATGQRSGAAGAGEGPAAHFRRQLAAPRLHAAQYAAPRRALHARGSCMADGTRSRRSSVAGPRAGRRARVERGRVLYTKAEHAGDGGAARGGVASRAEGVEGTAATAAAVWRLCQARALTPVPAALCGRAHRRQVPRALQGPRPRPQPQRGGRLGAGAVQRQAGPHAAAAPHVAGAPVFPHCCQLCGSAAHAALPPPRAPATLRWTLTCTYSTIWRAGSSLPSATASPTRCSSTQAVRGRGGVPALPPPLPSPRALTRGVSAPAQT